MTLQLKLLADVGLVGLPNAGKSSLLVADHARPSEGGRATRSRRSSRCSARSQGDERQLVIADIPGLIEGASAGAGLGHEFLAHVERTRLLVHVLDLAPLDGSDPVANHATVERELALHDARLAALPAAARAVQGRPGRRRDGARPRARTGASGWAPTCR